MMLKHGAEPVVYDDYGRSPLFLAALFGIPSEVSLFLKEKDEVTEDYISRSSVLNQSDIFGNLPLAAAAFSGCVSSTDMILKNNPGNVKGQNLRGDTALHVAAYRGNVKAAVAIAKADASVVNMTNKFGKTAFDVANARGFHLLAQLLKADVSKLDSAAIEKAHVASTTTEGRAGSKTLVMNHEMCFQVCIFYVIYIC
jgi:ankyrin repeat protein